VLLVAHRQIQQLQKRFDWEPPTALWTAVSWAVTMMLVSLGWIFFRANSLGTAGQMFAAVLTPASYSAHYLSGSLYLLVLFLAIGYAVVLRMSESLNQHAEDARSQTTSNGVMAMLSRRRWYWVPPLYALALLLVLMVTLTQSVTTAQFMYRAF
jgi:hypothetical protein